MKRILVTLPVEERHKRLLENQAPCEEIICCPLNQVTHELAQSAHVVIGNVAPGLLAGSTKLEWLQLHSAGTAPYADGMLRDGVILTNATGAYGLAIAEHLLGMTLCLQKKLHLYGRNQLQASWKDEGPVTSLMGATVLVVGLGDIGGEFAKRCKAMGSHVIGFRRVVRDCPEGVDEVHTLDRLDEMLPSADLVSLSLPATKETNRLFSAERLACMKKGAILLNVGRGTVLDQDALCDALESGHLGGAGLDVTDPEPLPAGHRLWKAPNLILTPHVSGGYHLAETFERIVRLSAGNLGRFLSGEPLSGVVDFATGYRRTEV